MNTSIFTAMSDETKNLKNLQLQFIQIFKLASIIITVSNFKSGKL